MAIFLQKLIYKIDTLQEKIWCIFWRPIQEKIVGQATEHEIIQSHDILIHEKCLKKWGVVQLGRCFSSHFQGDLTTKWILRWLVPVGCTLFPLDLF